MLYNKKISLVLLPLVTTSATIVPLTSCGSDGSVNDIGGYDLDFGFDALTYNRLEKQFQDLYWSKLQSDEKKDKYVVENKYNNFCTIEIASLRNQLFDPAKNYSYTTRTNTLIKYASQQHEINLVRNSKVSINDFTSLKTSSLESLQIYMSNLGLSDELKKENTDKFSDSFDEILVDCIKHSSDMAIILLELKSRLIECCSNLNDDCALAATYSKLKQFTDNHKFVVRNESILRDNNCLWDDLVKKAKVGDFIDGDRMEIISNQMINKPIKEKFINDIFEIKSTNNTNNNITLLANPIHSYSNDMIPGYTLTPVLVTMNEDIFSNDYNISIDWQLMNNAYKNKDIQKQKSLTAHCVLDKNGNMQTMENFSLDNIDVDEYQFNQYQLFASSNYQQNNLKKAYFNSSENKIKFTWDNNKKPSLNHFLPSNISIDEEKIIIASNNEYDQQMVENNLADSGLKLNNINLSELIKQENQNQRQATVSALNALTNGQKPKIQNNDNLSIEKKFVRYCVVNAINHVQFDSQVTHNTIKSEFVVGYKNTQEKYSHADEFEINNLIFSKEFAAEAVKNYNDVVAYVNAQLDTDALKSLLLLSALILVGFLTAAIYIALIIAYNFSYVNGSKNDVVSSTQKVIVYIIIGMVLIAWFTWAFAIAGPMQVQYDNVSYWNNSVKSGLVKLNIYDEIEKDREYCANKQDFFNYSSHNLGKSYELYWYYSHFVNAINNNDNGSVANKAIEDFNQFVDMRSQYEVTLHKNIMVWVGTMTILLVLVAAIITSLIIRKQLSLEEDKQEVDWSQITKNISESSDKINQANDAAKDKILDKIITIYTDFNGAKDEM